MVGREVDAVSGFASRRDMAKKSIMITEAKMYIKEGRDEDVVRIMG